MILTIAPDSILRENAGGIAGRAGRFAHWVWLAWLVWIFGPLFFPVGGRFEHWLWPTLASLPLFIALYVLAYLRPRRRIPWYAVAILVLGMLVTPYNPFIQTYLIYACAIAASWSSPRRSALLVLALIVVYSAQWFYLRLPWESIVNAWIICPIVTGLIITNRVQQRHRADLRLSMDEVRRLAASAERERIGRDLHDLLGHTLSMVALKSELAGRLIERDPRAARREIADVERVARESLAQVRSAVSGIRAAALVSELASARLLLEAAGVTMEYWCDSKDLPPEAETCLALVLREAVTNIQRHARANRVEITVIEGVEQAVMRIRDDGRGGVNERGNGLTGMRERIEARGGHLAIESPRGRGTSIEVRVPLLPRQPAVSAPGSDSRPVPIALGSRAGGQA